MFKGDDAGPHRADASTLPVTHGRFMDAVADPLGTLYRQYKTHGLISALQEGDQRVIFAFGPESNRRVLSDADTFHSYFFPLRGPKNSAQRRLTSGLLSENGSPHREHRRLLMEPFQRRVFPAYAERVIQLTQEMLSDWEIGRVLDLRETMTAFMLRVTSSLLFGFDQPELAYQLGEMIHRWAEMNHQVGIAAVSPTRVCQQRYDALLKFASALEMRISDMIRLRRQDSSGNDLLSILIRNSGAGQGFSEDELIGQTALLFSAAHLTTAHSLTWTLFLLAQHPECGRRLTDELEVNVGDGGFNWERFSGLPYTNRVVKESLRILPGSAYVQRVSMAPISLGPFRLSRGTIVVFSQFITHRLRELYVYPNRFAPDRWLTISPSPYEYLPFGAGPRRCLGGPLATVIMQTVIPMIWRRYRLRVQPGVRIDANAVSTMLTPMTPIPVQLLPRTAPFLASPISGNIHNYVDFPAIETRPRIMDRC
jgi:cytochrome P450